MGINEAQRTLCSVLWAAVLLLAIGAADGLAAPASAAATGGIEFKAEAGFNGKQKDGKWTRLRVTLTNRTERDLKGELAFTAMLSNGGYNVAYAVPAELPPGTPVVLELTVPGMAYNKVNNRLAFHTGKAPGGPTVPFTSNRPYVEAPADQATLIGVVARDPDTLNFMPILNTKGYDLNVVPIKEDDLPDRSIQLDGLDFLVLNDVPTGSWSESKREAVRAWVQRGGTLIVAGGAGYAKTAEGFADLAPVKPEGTASLKTAAALVQLAGGKTPLNLTVPVTLSAGMLAAGNVSIADGGLALAANRSYGNGQVVYAAFDPSLEPFASWTGSPDLWARLLGGSLTPVMPGTAVQAGIAPGGNMWEIDSLLNEFPSIQAPSVNVLIVFFFIYILIVAPVLYLVLRKLDRREWAWWIVPLASLASSVIIFTVGASDKSATLAHSLRIAELSGDGDGIRSAAAAVFVPGGGRVEAAFEPGVALLPFQDGRGAMGSVAANPTYQTVHDGTDETSVVWNEVPYWSVRKTWVRYDKPAQLGRFAIGTELKAGKLTVTVKNETGADLTNVGLLFNGTAFKLQNLKQGESSKTTVPLVVPNGLGGFYDYGGQLFPWPSNNGDIYARERGLLNSFMNAGQRAGAMRMPYVVGFSSDREAWFTINGKRAGTDNLTLWAQALDLYAAESGGFVAPGTITPMLTVNKTGRYSYDPMSGRIDFSQGLLEFEFVLPAGGRASYDSLTVYGSRQLDGQLQTTVWNEKKQSWEQVDFANASSFTPADPADNYVTANGSIRMRLETASQAGTFMPTVGLKGKGKP
ncbi:MAG TPA: hypothetical protein VMS09_04290 [Paenibacillus sp.]|uniref:DUF7408 domain-containing protein n=1 Tax=Paenibacillus sp. TaxID=58172 RepID=UPI002CA23676|nr:hypothetical protein [Paenibacillus sp.]HUC91234.1 hypothetical protein [Paenibacillus sp.]